MTDDDQRYADLFKGKPGTVLGSSNEPPIETRVGFVSAKKKAVSEKRLPPRRNHSGRMPPGQDVVDTWPVLDLGHQPLVSTNQWSLDIKGDVTRPLSIDCDAFNNLPQSKINADIHCVTAWSLLNNVWEGVSARQLIAMVQPREATKHVIFHAHDGYRANVSMTRFAEENALLARTWNGAPTTREHGGPVRMVMPSLYFCKSAKWVR